MCSQERSYLQKLYYALRAAEAEEKRTGRKVIDFDETWANFRVSRGAAHTERG